MTRWLVGGKLIVATLDWCSLEIPGKACRVREGEGGNTWRTKCIFNIYRETHQLLRHLKMLYSMTNADPTGKYHGKTGFSSKPWNDLTVHTVILVVALWCKHKRNVYFPENVFFRNKNISPKLGFWGLVVGALYLITNNPFHGHWLVGDL